ncbi:aminotransferase [Piedraia hortae CBS 480.64]|uniref:alanine--glyoxylate transaminase n=1 Tax=Piedraia hortae CBS 480.64 TaxID=1314780 RepID=A0A6A7C9Z0_9PEZI|nr:aminotransferase [Piedraia hortae CBS 480.64]
MVPRRRGKSGHWQMAPHHRLFLIARHLESDVPLNTPFSVGRDEAYQSQPAPITSRSQGTQTIQEPEQKTNEEEEEEENSLPKMASHPALMIPGPIEVGDEVSQAMTYHAESHVGKPFVNIFGETLEMVRKLFQATDKATQPFVITGSGTLGWDQVATNLLEAGDQVLVLHTGYFADSFADCLETYGAKVTQLKAPIGERPKPDEIEKALGENSYRMLTVTHTDTSTGVLSDIKAITALVRKVSPSTLVVVDGVCSVGCEEIQFTDWDIDCVLTASQKALGCPTGLSILMVSDRAMQRFHSRKEKPASYYASWKNWLPIMQNYEARKPSYFATPSTQLVRALHASLTNILGRPLQERFAQHRDASAKVKAAVKEVGLKQLAADPNLQANGMTAFYLPEGITPPDVLPKFLEKHDLVLAGGLHKQIATKYLRIGHMGVSVTDQKRSDIGNVVKAVKEVLGK